MNLNIFTDFTEDIPFESRIKLIKSTGFNAVMMFFTDKESFEKQVLTIKENGLRIENVHCPFGMMNNLWTDENAFETILKVQTAIDMCHCFGIPVLVIHPTDTKNPPKPTQTGISYFNGLARYAQRQNVWLAFENIERPEYLDVIFDKVEGKNVKFCYDVGHENCFSKDTDCLTKYAEKLCALHIHDNDGDTDGHKIPFDGNIDFENFAQKLKATKYHGAISLELMMKKSHDYDTTTPEEFITKAYSAAQRLKEIIEK